MTAETKALDAAIGGLKAPADEQGPVFQEPWEAQAFALAVCLHQQDHFEWTEWSETLAREIRHAQGSGDPDHGDTYYRHWLSALEHLVQEKGLLDETALLTRRAEISAIAPAPVHVARREPVAISEASGQDPVRSNI